MSRIACPKNVMTNLAGSFLTLLALFSMCPSARAGNAMAIVPADEAGREAHIVNKGINWHTSLQDAEAEARREGKLVFWMHMLGTIDGAT